MEKEIIFRNGMSREKFEEYFPEEYRRLILHSWTGDPIKTKMQYCVITTSMKWELSPAVNKACEQDWVPVGGVSYFSQDGWTQAMQRKTYLLHTTHLGGETARGIWCTENGIEAQ